MDQRQLPEDFKEFIRFFNKNEVCYLLVGGWATGLYGHPRATKDIGFLVATDDENLEKLKSALSDFGAPSLDLEPFKENGSVYRMGRHSVLRMAERNIQASEVEDVLLRGRVIREYPEDKPLPSFLAIGMTANSPVHVVYSRLGTGDDVEYFVITVYKPDLAEWDATFTSRRHKS
jgi:hypothetical protein